MPVKRLTVALALLSAGVLPVAHAALTENLLTSSTAMSLGNAVTADPPGIESIHFNPAGLARMTGDSETQTMLGASVRTSATFRAPAGFDIGGFKDDPVDGKSSGPVRQALYIPMIGIPGKRLPGVVLPGLGFSFNKPGSPFTFATMSYLTLAYSVDRTKDPDDPAGFDGRLVQLQRLVYLSPAVGYKVSDTLRIGVAVPIAHSAIALNTDMRLPNTLIGITGKIQEGWCPKGGGNPIDTLTFGLCGGGDAGRLNPFKKAANLDLSMTAPVDPTINLGVLWEPIDSFALGLVYQSGSKAVHTGRYEFNTEPMVRNFVGGLYSSLLGPIVASVLGLPPSVPEVQSGNVTATVPFPSHFQIGVKVKPLKFLQLNVDANYTDWGSWDALTFQFDQSIKLLEVARMFGVANSSQLVIPRGYRSVWHWGFGLQAQVTNALKLRVGYEPRKSSIPADKIDLIAPLPDTKVFSVGFNYQLDPKTDINFGASYMKGDFSAPANTSCNLNCTNFLNLIYNPYAGLDVSGGIRVRYVGMSYNKRF
jgi:long-subunit fatty acid transport protein